MSNPSIRRLRWLNLTLALFATVAFGLAMTSDASAEDFRLIQSKYRVEVTGQ